MPNEFDALFDVKIPQAEPAASTNFDSLMDVDLGVPNAEPGIMDIKPPSFAEATPTEQPKAIPAIKESTKTPLSSKPSGSEFDSLFAVDLKPFPETTIAGTTVKPLKDFERRMQDSNAFITNPDGTVSTHKMVWAQMGDKYIAFPTIVPVNGLLEELPIKDAQNFALKNDEYKTFDTPRAAEDYAAGSWKKGTPWDKNPQAQDLFPQDMVTEETPKEKPVSGALGAVVGIVKQTVASTAKMVGDAEKIAVIPVMQKLGLLGFDKMTPEQINEFKNNNPWYKVSSWVAGTVSNGEQNKIDEIAQAGNDFSDHPIDYIKANGVAKTIETLADNVAVMVPLTLSSFAGPLPGMVMATAVEADQFEQQARRAGITDEKIINAAKYLDGVPNGIIEYGSNQILRPLKMIPGGSKIVNAITGKVKSKALARFLVPFAHAIGAGIMEGPVEEGSQGEWQDIVMYGAARAQQKKFIEEGNTEAAARIEKLLPELKSKVKSISDQSGAALMGFIGGVAMGAPSTAADFLHVVEQQKSKTATPEQTIKEGKPLTDALDQFNPTGPAKTGKNIFDELMDVPTGEQIAAAMPSPRIAKGAELPAGLEALKPTGGISETLKKPPPVGAETAPPPAIPPAVESAGPTVPEVKPVKIPKRSSLSLEEFRALPDETQKLVYEQNEVTGKPGQGAFNRILKARTEDHTKPVLMAVGDLNGFKVYNDKILGSGKTDELNSSIYDVQEGVMGLDAVTNNHGDEYFSFAEEGEDAATFQKRLQQASTSMAQIRVEYNGKIYRPTMTWKLAYVSKPEEVGDVNVKDLGPNKIGVDKSLQKIYTNIGEVAGANIPENEIVTRSLLKEEVKNEKPISNAGIRPATTGRAGGEEGLRGSGESILPSESAKPKTVQPGTESKSAAVGWDAFQDPNSTTNEARKRLVDPKEFDPTTFRRFNGWAGKKAPAGIQFVVGNLKATGEKAVQTVRFNKNTVSPEQAEKYFAEIADTKAFPKTWTEEHWKVERPEYTPKREYSAIALKIKQKTPPKPPEAPGELAPTAEPKTPRPPVKTPPATAQEAFVPLTDESPMSKHRQISDTAKNITKASDEELFEANHIADQYLSRVPGDRATQEKAKAITLEIYDRGYDIKKGRYVRTEEPGVRKLARELEKPTKTIKYDEESDVPTTDEGWYDVLSGKSPSDLIAMGLLDNIPESMSNKYKFTTTMGVDKERAAKKKLETEFIADFFQMNKDEEYDYTSQRIRPKDSMKKFGREGIDEFVERNNLSADDIDKGLTAAIRGYEKKKGLKVSKRKPSKEAVKQTLLSEARGKIAKEEAAQGPPAPDNEEDYNKYLKKATVKGEEILPFSRWYEKLLTFVGKKGTLGDGEQNATQRTGKSGTAGKGMGETIPSPSVAKPTSAGELPVATRSGIGVLDDTRELRDIENALSAELGGIEVRGEIGIVEPSGEHKEAILALQKTFPLWDIRVVRLSANLHTKIPFDGVRINGRIYLNETTQNPVFWVLIHEAGHLIEERHPGLYSLAMNDIMAGLSMAGQEARMNRAVAESRGRVRVGMTFSELEAEYNKLSRLRKKIGSKEIFSDTLADSFMGEGFLDSLYQKSPEFFKALIRSLVEAYSKFIKAMRRSFAGRTDPQWFKDAVAVQDRMARFMSDVIMAEHAMAGRVETQLKINEFLILLKSDLAKLNPEFSRAQLDLFDRSVQEEMALPETKKVPAKSLEQTQFPGTEESQTAKDIEKYKREQAEKAAAPAGPEDVPIFNGNESAKAAEAQGSFLETPVKSSKLQDFGEKIGGAKKDIWSTYKDRLSAAKELDIKVEPLSKSWPEPDYQSLLDNGADPWGVAFLHAARDEVPRKPVRPYRLSAWAEQVKTMRDMTGSIIELKIGRDKARAMLANAATLSRGMQDVAGRIDLYMTVGHEKSLADLSLSVGDYTYLNGEKFDKATTMWSVDQKTRASAFSNWPRQLATGRTKEETLANFKDKFASLNTDTPAKQTSFDIYSRRDKTGYWIGKKVGRNYLDLAGPFEKVSDARTYKVNNQNTLIEKLEKAKEIPNERRDINNPRVGEDMRGGVEVTPKMFSEAFGFKGVEFGNWVEQEKRQKDLNDSYDALMDMAAILDVTPKALSLNGELGLAFGARGSGGIHPAAAHYEANKIVINLTKKEGAGSLAHEWWHALDNYFSRMRLEGSKFMTNALDVSLAGRGSEYIGKPGVRKEMIEAFGKIVGTVSATAMRKRAGQLDKKRSSEYWGLGEELAARAFEGYIISKLQDQNASNDYLANIVDAKTWKAAESLGFEMDESYPYPNEAELPSIREAFQNFFDVVEEKTTDKGVALFSRQEIIPRELNVPVPYEEEKAPFRNFTRPSETTKDVIRRKLVDKYTRLLRLQEEVEKRKGSKLSESEDAYLKQTVFQGKVKYAMDRFGEKYLEPIQRIMARTGLTMREVGLYLYAKHARERNSQIAKINPKFAQQTIINGIPQLRPGSGMPDLVADAIVEHFEESGKATELETIGRMVQNIDDYHKTMLQYSGLKAPEEMKAWSATYKNYVPLKGFQEEDLALRGMDEDQIEQFTKGLSKSFGGTGKGFSVNGKTVRALGRETAANVDDILANLIMGVHTDIIKAGKNNVSQAFLNMVINNPDPKLWEIAEPPTKPYMNERTGKVEHRVDPTYKRADNILTVMVKGEEYIIKINDPLLARALKNLGQEQGGKIMEALGTLNRYFAFMITAANPEFVITNFARDIQTVLANTTAEESKAIAYKTMKSVPGALRGMWGSLRGKHDTEWQRWADKYQAAGGKVEFIGLENIDQTQKRLINEIRSFGNNKTANAMRYLRGIKDLVMDANSAVESASRLAMFRTLVESGVSEDVAAAKAKSVTVNFNQKGELGQAMNTLYLFANASMQGSARLIRMLKSKKGKIIAAGLTVLGLLMAELNRWLSPDGDDGEDEYDKISEWEKRNNWILMKPNGSHFKFPMPYGLNVFMGMGGIGDDLVRGKVTAAKAAVDAVSLAMNVFNPIGGGGVLQTVSPTILDPFVDLRLNENFAGNPIYKEQAEYEHLKPRSELYYKKASETSKAVASKLNSIMGGDAYVPAKLAGYNVSVYPDAIDYLVRYGAGGLGDFINRNIGLAGKVIKKEPVQPQDVPFVRRLYSGDNKYYDEQAFYDRINTVKTANNVIEMMQENGDPGLGRFAINNAEEIDLYNSIGRGTESRVRALNQQKRLVIANGGDPKELEDQLDKIYAEFNRAYVAKIGVRRGEK